MVGEVWDVLLILVVAMVASVGEGVVILAMNTTVVERAVVEVIHVVLRVMATVLTFKLVVGVVMRVQMVVAVVLPVHMLDVTVIVVVIIVVVVVMIVVVSLDRVRMLVVFALVSH